mgnify:CR=1 FL=1
MDFLKDRNHPGALPQRIEAGRPYIELHRRERLVQRWTPILANEEPQ